MDIQILGFKAIRQAKFDVRGVTLIGGLNEAGKSSCLTAIGAVLAREAVVGGITDKKQAAKLVTDGEEIASVTARTAAGTARLRWPSCEVSEDGAHPPTLTVLSAGLRRFTAQKPEDRAKLLIKLLDAAPTKEDLVKALEAINANEAAIKVLWDAIETSGWDAVLKSRKELGTKVKGAWEQITGEKWGSQRAKTWEPKGWDDGLRLIKDEAVLRAAIEDARQKFEAALKSAAVDGAEMQRLSDLAAMVDAYAAEMATKEEEGKKAGAAVEEAKTAIGQLKALIEPTQPCPHCAKPVKVDALGVVVKPNKPMSDDEAAENKARLGQWERALQTRQDAHQKARDAYTFARNQWIEAHAAANRLKAIQEAGGEEAASAAQVEEARAEKEARQAQLQMWQAWTGAHEQYRKWAVNDALCDILEPEGLRKTKLDASLANLNARLEQISRAFRQPPVKIDGDMDVWMGDRAYGLLSESARWRADLALQVAMGEAERAPLIIVDRADVLNRVWKERVIGGLVALKQPAIVAMAANGPELLPELEGAGGRTYWVVDGTVLTRAEAIAAANKAA